MQRVEKGLTGEGGVGEIAWIAQIRIQVVATPKTSGVAGERVGPTLDEEAGIGFVAQFSAG